MKFLLHFAIIPFAIFLTSSSNLAAQGDDDVNLNLAREFYHSKEYDKAIDLLTDLYKKDQGQHIYSLLLNSYLSTDQLKEAENLTKQQTRKYPGEKDYVVDYGFVLIKSGNEKKGEDVYQDAIKDLRPLAKEAIDLSRSFQRRNELEFAIAALKQGRKLMNGTYGFEFELAELYYQKGDIEAMVDQYLSLIETNEQYMQNVQNALHTSIYNDLNKAHLQTLNQALLKRVQRHPDRTVFAELLMWHYLQQKEFESAIIQAKALDRRNHENGKRFLSLAAACRSNRTYDLAMLCYQYLIDMGPSSVHYINARILMTETIREKITASKYTLEDLKTLETNYLTTLEDLGRNAPTISLQIGLAEVWAFYLEKKEAAIDLLEDALTLSGLKQQHAAECKMTLGDIYLSNGEIWEASLLFSQVEKDFKYDVLGDEAKFRNARISFYTGDFLWAKAQLDVLKGSTSKLISNDALRLSLTISDNMLTDTAGEALKMYANAALMVQKNDLDQALSILDTMSRIYTVHSIMDEVLYLQYEVYFQKQQFSKAAERLEKLRKEFAGDILADEAVFKLAELYDYYLNDAEKAQELYKELMTNYASSIHIVAARNRFRAMRGDSLN